MVNQVFIFLNVSFKNNKSKLIWYKFLNYIIKIKSQKNENINMFSIL